MSAAVSPGMARMRVGLRVGGVLCCIALLAIGCRLAFVQWRLVGDSAPNFTLIDENGRPWTLAQERGHRAVALFFGYTHCPDVCPTTLAHLTQARRLLGADRSNLRIVFVTVDAPRDTSAVLKRYVALFDPSIVGLTGGSDRVDPVYAAYHVWHQAVPQSDGAGGYLVTHTSAIYLIDRSGRLRGIADWGDATTHLAARLRELVS